jgi:DNA-directed RNA polymerase specialized sigma24 family protein
MEIPPHLFTRAQKLKRPAVEALFASVYPAVLRIARGLSGRIDVADGVVRFVMLRAPTMLPRWRDATAAERWFLHHTLLTARRAAAHEPTAKNDLLAADADPRYAAFVRAIRQLPIQQREAVILHLGERFNPRFLGVAMDCSTEAAQNHLDAATTTLRGIAGNDFAPLADRLATAYARLGPAADDVAPAAGRWAGKALRPHRFRRFVRRVVIAIILALLVLAGWQWRPRLGF